MVVHELEDEVPPYPDVDQDASVAAARSLTIRADQFFGRPLATVVREILTPRAQNQQGAMPLDELFAVMTKGGFDLEGKDETAKKRTLAITIGKNPAFLRVPNSGDVGLADWYPNVKKERKPSSPGDTPEVPATDGKPVESPDGKPPVTNEKPLESS